MKIPHSINGTFRFKQPYLVFSLCLILLGLIPLWTFPYIPTQDGPSHLENVAIIKAILSNNAPIIEHFYALNSPFFPTWPGHLILLLLSLIFDDLIAEKILLSSISIVTIWSAYYAVSAISRARSAAIVLLVPCVQSYLYFMGFHSYILSQILFWFAIGLALRHGLRPLQFHLIVTVSLSLLLFNLHMFTWAMVLLALTIKLSFDIAGDIYSSQDRSLGSIFSIRFMKKITAEISLLILAASVGVPQLVFHNLERTKVETGSYGERLATYSHAEIYQKLSDRIEAFFSLDSLVSYSRTEFLSSIAVSALLIVLGLLAVADRKRWGGAGKHRWLLATAGVVTVAYFVVPRTLFGGSFILERISLYPVFFLVLWLGTQRVTEKLRGLISATISATYLVVVISNTVAFAQLNTYLKSYVSTGRLIGEHSVILPISYSHSGPDEQGEMLYGERASLKVKSFLHMSSYLTIDRDVVQLGNYEGMTGYFPVVYRVDVSPAKLLVASGHMEDVPPSVDIGRFEEHTGERIDYVIVWARQASEWRDSSFDPFLSEIGQSFSRVEVDHGSDLIEIFVPSRSRIRSAEGEQ